MIMKDTALDYILVNKLFSLEIQVHKVSQNIPLNPYYIKPICLYRNKVLRFNVTLIDPSYQYQA